MEDAIGETERLFPSRRLAGNGLKAYETARKKGWEGVVAKDASAPYVEGRSTKWLKVKAKQEDEFVIVGFTQPGGARTHFGALLLGAHRGKDLLYVGKVGTGFTQKTLDALHAKAPAARAPDASGREPAAGEGSRLGRAEARRADRLPGVDGGRRAPAAAGLPRSARRQETRRSLPAGSAVMPSHRSILTGFHG
jgi:bifunctional non-homologous end joining protein LigD